RAMLDAVERAGVKHMIGFNYRKAPALAMAKQLVEQGEIGRVLRFHAEFFNSMALTPAPLSWRYQKNQAGSGALGDLGSHVIDVARFLVGDVERVCALADTFIAERPLASGPFDALFAGGGEQARREMGAVDTDDAASFLCRFDNGAPGSIEC